MKFHIFVGLLYVLPLNYASAAALESRNQSIQAFFEKGNYTEVALLQVDPNISGQVQHQQNKVGQIITPQKFVDVVVVLMQLG
jgi:hypothetical protein